MEEVDDEDVYPRNVAPLSSSHILELSDGSEDDDDEDNCPPLVTADEDDNSDDDNDDDNNNNNADEASGEPEESAEAELGQLL